MFSLTKELRGVQIMNIIYTNLQCVRWGGIVCVSRWAVAVTRVAVTAAAVVVIVIIVVIVIVVLIACIVRPKQILTLHLALEAGDVSIAKVLAQLLHLLQFQ